MLATTWFMGPRIGYEVSGNRTGGTRRFAEGATSGPCALELSSDTRFPVRTAHGRSDELLQQPHSVSSRDPLRDPLTLARSFFAVRRRSRAALPGLVGLRALGRTEAC